MATALQAAEHIVIGSATAVVTQVATSHAADLKSIENNVAKDAVSVANEKASSLVDKVQDGIADVATEVVKGANVAIEAVEQHPELIAEGALAVAVGVASLVQPELVAGEVAIVGKMATDSAKKTATKIASDTGSKFVKAISQDIADDAKEEAVKDVAANVPKNKEEGDEKGEEIAKQVTDPKATSRDLAKDVQDKSKLAAKIEKFSAEQSDPKSTPGDSAKSIPYGVTPASSDSKYEPANATTPKDRTITIEVAQETSKDVNAIDTSSEDAKSGASQAAPVSLKIIMGADGEVEAVTKGDVKENTKVAILPSMDGEAAIGPKRTAKYKREPVQQSPTTLLQNPTSASAIAQQVAPQTKENEEQAHQKSTTSLSSNENPGIAQLNALDSDKSSSVSPSAVVSTISSVKSTTKTNAVPKTNAAVPAATSISQIMAVGKDNKEETTKTSIVPPSSGQVPEVLQQPSQITDKSPPLSSPAVFSAMISTTETRTIPTSAGEASDNTSDSQMVTISQESLNQLHQKLDTMHEAIQHITKVLAFHMPIPTAHASKLKSPYSVEDEINEALATAIRPLTDLVPEIILQHDDATHPPLVDPSSPKRPTFEKRASVLSVIGKALWPFGSSSDKAPTVTLTKVTASRTEVEA